MNELMSENECQSLKEKLIFSILWKKKTFEDFFVAVSKLRIKLSFDSLKLLSNIVYIYRFRFDSTLIVYLKDTVDTEMAIPCKQCRSRQYVEDDMQETIVKKFKNIFPNYEFVGTEVVVNGIGRIDILASYNNRPVIIELKTERKNPNKQLLAYATKFDDPILIGITEQEIRKDLKLDCVQYLIFDELVKNK